MLFPKRSLFLHGLLLLSGLIASPFAQAAIRVPAVFSDHMIMQRNQPIPVWGWADPGQAVVVTIGPLTNSAVADADGRWQLHVNPLPAGGPHQFQVQAGRMDDRQRVVASADGQGVSFNDVWVGEVWLCSGQSNMAMTVNRALNFTMEQQQADWPQLRMFKVANKSTTEPQVDCAGEWTICTPETVGTFSATAYFFARELQAELKVPVGIINASVGGTPIDSWIRFEAQEALPELRPVFAAREAALKTFDPIAARARHEQAVTAWKEKAKQARAAGQPVPRAPQDPVALHERKTNLGGLYNGMVAPVIKYGFRGALWYQGEANSTPEKAELYQYQLPLLVRDWRLQHGGGDFPFAWVQLPNFQGSGRNWPLVREAMLKSLSVPNTGMAIILDVGETKDIHPKNKQTVGQRLAKWALSTVHQREGVPGGPMYQEHSISGNQVRVKFANCQGLDLLRTPSGLAAFAVADADRHWHPATASIDGDTLVISAPQVSAPVAARYAWANDPPSLLVNAAGLPASPFRTDNWTDAKPFDQP